MSSLRSQGCSTKKTGDCRRQVQADRCTPAHFRAVIPPTHAAVRSTFYSADAPGHITSGGPASLGVVDFEHRRPEVRIWGHNGPSSGGPHWPGFSHKRSSSRAATATAIWPFALPVVEADHGTRNGRCSMRRCAGSDGILTYYRVKAAKRLKAG